MAREIKWRGSGISQRQEVTYAAPFDAQDNKAIREAFQAAPRFDFEGLHGAPLEEAARSVLRAHGLPEEWRTDYPHGDLSGEVLAAGHVEDSVPHLAAQILSVLHVVRGRIAAGDMTQATRFAVELGALAQLASLKVGWERDALAGRRVAEGGRRGADEAHGDAASRAEFRAELRRSYGAARANGAKSKYAACVEVGTLYGVSYKTVERALK